MTYRKLTNINIGLQNVSVSRQGFGIPLFASSHRYFPERVRSYTSLSAVAKDVPTESNAYKAAQAYFGESPSPNVVKLGRREANLELSVATGATGASFTIFASEAGTTYSLDVTVTGEVDETAVATAIAAAIEADLDIGDLVVASATGDTVSIDVTGPSNEFWVKTLSEELTESYTSTETAPELINAIEDEDSDFYFFSSDDHTETFVLAAAEDIEARLKMYFFSVQEASALTPYTEGAATDILGKIIDGGYNKTKGFFHHNADSVFAEATHVAMNAVYRAGSVLWSNVPVTLSPSQDPSTGRPLTSTQKTYLESRNASYVERAAATGVTTSSNIVRNNKVASGEWISNIRGKDSLEVDLSATYLELLLSQKGSKIPYTEAGISLLRATCQSVLELYVLRQFIKPNYKLEFLPASQISNSDRQAGVYNGGSFAAELQQGILFVDVSGSLALDLG